MPGGVCPSQGAYWDAERDDHPGVAGMMSFLLLLLLLLHRLISLARDLASVLLSKHVALRGFISVDNSIAHVDGRIIQINSIQLTGLGT
jgi:hypothetical protein